MIFFFLRIAIIAIVVSPPVDPYFDASLPRHVLLQIPILVIGGYLTGRSLKKTQLDRFNYFGLGGLFFFLGTLFFWMIPRSLDAAVSDNLIDQMMHFNLVLAGFMFAISLPLMPVILRVALGVYGLSMIFSLGIVYSKYEGLICAVYTIDQQKVLGGNLLWIGGVLSIVLLVRAALVLRN